MMRIVIAAGMALALALAGVAGRAAPVKADVQRGKYLATVLGCTSCHGTKLDGHDMFDDATIAVLYSSNLSRRVPRYTDAQLDAVIRTGKRPDGSILWWMDAAPYAVLRKEDMRALIAFLRSAPPTGIDHPRIKMGPRFLKAMQAGRIRPESATLARDLANPAPDLGPATAEGRYLARTRCGVCHAPNLTGTPDPQPGDSPDLKIAAGYTQAQFRTLVLTGKARGNREVGEMSTEARKRFSGMKVEEVDAILAYLKARR